MARSCNGKFIVETIQKIRQQKAADITSTPTGTCDKCGRTSVAVFKGGEVWPEIHYVPRVHQSGKGSNTKRGGK